MNLISIFALYQFKVSFIKFKETRMIITY